MSCRHTCKPNFFIFLESKFRVRISIFVFYFLTAELYLKKPTILGETRVAQVSVIGPSRDLRLKSKKGNTRNRAKYIW